MTCPLLPTVDPRFHTATTSNYLRSLTLAGESQIYNPLEQTFETQIPFPTRSLQWIYLTEPKWRRSDQMCNRHVLDLSPSVGKMCNSLYVRSSGIPKKGGVP